VLSSSKFCERYSSLSSLNNSIALLLKENENTMERILGGAQRKESSHFFPSEIDFSGMERRGGGGGRRDMESTASGKRLGKSRSIF